MKKTAVLISTFIIAVFSATAQEPEATITASNPKYYSDVVVSFGQSINSKGELAGEAYTFSLVKGKIEITARLEMDKPFNVTQIRTEVFADELVSNTPYKIARKEWTYLAVPIELTKAGSYNVDFYTQDNVYITSSSFEVK
jgi:hypothetical protein